MKRLAGRIDDPMDRTLVKQHRSVTQEEFDSLLLWLDADPERAGQRYVEIRQKLIRNLARRGCWEAEELADETMNRVAVKVVCGIGEGYVGDQAAYFCGVAHNVCLEWLKDLNRDRLPMPPPDPPEEKERCFDCLESCLKQLDADDRNLIIEYYRDEKRAKIDHRKELSEKLGVTLNTLRMRAHRIKMVLQQCVGDCLTQTKAS